MVLRYIIRNGGNLVKTIYLNGEISSYRIDADGNVFGKRGLLHPIVWGSRKKYLMYSFNHKGNKVRILAHRLVATYCLDHVPMNSESLTVNHKDGNAKNNRPENLEWSTQEDNIIHAFATNLAEGKCYRRILATKEGFEKEYRSLRQCAIDLDLNPGNLHVVLRYPEGERTLRGYRFVELN